MLNKSFGKIVNQQNQIDPDKMSLLKRETKEISVSDSNVSIPLKVSLSQQSHFVTNDLTQSELKPHIDQVNLEETKLAADSKESIEQIAWEWQSSTSGLSQWTPYRASDSYRLEVAYLNKAEEVDLGDYVVYISSKSMFQKNKYDASKQMQIRRNKKPPKGEETLKREQNFRSERFIVGEAPKTYSNAFGSLDDYLSFFENRTPEMTSFTEALRKAEANQNLDILNQDITPIVIDSIKKEAHKMIGKKTGKNHLMKLFKKTFKSFEEFYGAVLKAYTMEAFLYHSLNQYLRMEDWIQLDGLLPYVFCLCKTFLCIKLTSTCNEKLKKSIASQSGSLCPLVLYRGAQFDEDLLSSYNKPGTMFTFSWNAVTSTSTNPSIAEFFMESSPDPNKVPVMFVIEVPMSLDDLSNLNVIDIKTLSEVPEEDEIALAPGTIFELLSYTRDPKRAEVKLRLISNSNALSRQGKIMHGAMHVQVSKGKTAKIICQKGKELAEAFYHMRGNRTIEEIELTLCGFDDNTLKNMTESLSTLPNLNRLALFSVYSQQKNHLEAIFKSVAKLAITSIEIDDGALGSQNQLTSFVEATRLLVSLEYLKINLEPSSTHIEDSWMKIFCVKGLQHMTSLKTLILDFRNCDKITDEELKSLFLEGIQYLTSLKTLSLNFTRCRKITDVGMNVLFPEGMRNLTSLTAFTLSISDCDKITDEGVKHFSVRGIRHLTTLTALNIDVERCHEITDSGLRSLFVEGINYLASLTALNLNLRRCKITDEGVKNFCIEGFRYLPPLGALTLNFSGCDKLTDEGLNLLFSEGIKYQTSLTTLELLWTKTLTNEGAKSLLSKGIRHLSSLTTLCLFFDQCNNITDEGVKSICSEGIKHLTSLTTLSLQFYFCKSITNDGVKGLSSERLRYLASLKALTLSFAGCHLIDDEGVKSLCSEGIRYLVSLTNLTLSFRDCSLITDKGVMSLYSEGVRHLALLIALSLDVSGCNITEKGLDHLRFQDGIRKISLDLCTNYRLQRILKMQRKDNSRKILSDPEESSVTTQDAMILDSRLKSSYFHDEYIEKGRLNLLKSLRIDYGSLQKEVSVEEIDRLYIEGIKHLVSLTSLYLDFARYKDIITNERVRSLCSEGLRYLTSLSGLTVRLFLCNNFTDKGMKSLGSEGIRYLTSLKTLNLDLAGCKDITDTGIENICSEGVRHLTNLTELTLNFGECNITDEGIEYLVSKGIRYLSSLTDLTLEFDGCKNITDKGVSGLSFEGYENLTSLKSLKLDFTMCKGITDEGVKNLCSQGISCLTSLTTLYLRFALCKEITDEGLKSLGSIGLKNLKNLTKLTLEFVGCIKITEEGLKIMCSEGIRYLSSLSNLRINLGGCKNITTEGMNILCSEGIRHLISLTNLNLGFWGCDNITDEGINALCRGIKCLTSLTTLSLGFGMCKNITAEGVRILCSDGIRYLTSLTDLDLNLDDCAQISERSMRDLALFLDFFGIYSKL